jgi:hypothetical protein
MQIALRKTLALQSRRQGSPGAALGGSGAGAIMEPTGGVSPMAMVAFVERQMEESAHGAPTGEAAWPGVAMMPQAEMAVPGTDKPQSGATTMPQAGAAQIGPPPKQTETAVPMIEAVELDASVPLQTGAGKRNVQKPLPSAPTIDVSNL